MSFLAGLSGQLRWRLGELAFGIRAPSEVRLKSSTVPAVDPDCTPALFRPSRWRHNRWGVRAYRRLQLTLASVFAVYLVLAAVEQATAKKGAAFPVIAWSLFEKVPNRTVFYTASVRSLDGRAFDPERDLLDLERSIRGKASLSIRATVQLLGAAIAAGDEERVAAKRRALEQVALGGREMRYEIVERTYADPRDAWRGAPPVSTRAVAAFASRGDEG